MMAIEMLVLDHQCDEDAYTSTATHIRIFLEGGTYSIDGADDDGRYTVSVWSGYQTIADAMAAAEEFVQSTTIDGVRWDWSSDRPKGLRRAPGWGAEL